MKPYDKLTIIRNRARARDLRRFRVMVEAYFSQAEYDFDGRPMDWEGARAARAEINRMLRRVIQIVDAAELDAPLVAMAGAGSAARGLDALNNIFTARYADGSGQEILDVIDLALGVYENSRFAALARTVNPFHYVGTALGFVAGLPRRLFTAIGFGGRPGRAGIREEDLARLEAAASRMAGVEALIERRFAEMSERHAQESAQQSHELVELAERIDFAERMLSQHRPPTSLKPPDRGDAITPV